MDPRTRPYRSVLYIPGSKPRALEKAKTLPVDAVIFDLEDAVSVEEKENARDTLAAALAEGGYGARVRIVRINGFDTPWGKDDARAAAAMDCDAILLPKVSSPADLDALAEVTGDKPLWAMMETPRGMLNAAEIAAHPKLQGMVMGTNDLAKELRAEQVAGRHSLVPYLAQSLLAARAEGTVILDGVYNDIKNEDGFLAECRQGFEMGFDGKTLIHPSQVGPTNDVWAPSEEEIEHARKVITAFEEAEAEGRGVITVDGRMIENLHVDNARRALAVADAIAALEG